MEFGGKCWPWFGCVCESCGAALGSGWVRVGFTIRGQIPALGILGPFAGTKVKSRQETLVVSAPILSLLNF